MSQPTSPAEPGLDRRELVVGATIAMSALGSGATARAAPDAGQDGLPMPPPRPGPDAAPPVGDPNRTRLDDGWRFHLGDVAFPPIRGHVMSYEAAKAGGALGAAADDYDDSDWAEVTLPHDWASAQPFDRDANVSQGYRARGIGWYRRALRLDPADRGKAIEVEFGAIATYATVWVNGVLAARSWSGSTPLRIDLTPYARFGDTLNTLAVRVDAEAEEGWWYEGAGAYRHAWLTRRAATHIVTDGVQAEPRRDPASRWTVPVAVTLANIGETKAELRLAVALKAPEGALVAHDATTATVGPLGRTEAVVLLAVARPHLWSVDDPALHTLSVRLFREGAEVDARDVQLGFRTIRFDPERGFFLNDAPLKLKGACVHQDHAGVGVAVPDALWTWRLSRLKAMGANAIRCAHGAPAPELLDACDRLGVLVMDENRQFTVTPVGLGELETLIRRDRNHPSVILWSLFNEEPLQESESGFQMARRMTAAAHALDPGRPTIAAMNGGLFAPVNVTPALDVVGINYQADAYDRFHAAHPTQALTSSEDTSALMTRGAFATDRGAHVISSYDDEAADWGLTHRAAWKAIAERPFLAGAFIWTGFDYHGEPTPFTWPSASSFFGAMDLCGFPKTAFHIHAAQWIDDAPVLEIAPHWTWPGREGEPIRVMVLTNAERAELLLNGRSLGRQAVERFVFPQWRVPYAPGVLEAVAYRGGREVARRRVTTAGPPVGLRLTPDRRVMAGDGEDAQPLTVDAVDARGRHAPVAQLPVTFAIQGGVILGLGNGDPNSHEPEKGAARSLFNGLAQVIVRADAGSGDLVVSARAPGVRPAQLAVRRIARPQRPSVPVTRAVQQLDGWRRSPLFHSRPDPGIAPGEGDMNSWAPVAPGDLSTPSATGWAVYRTVFTPRASARRAGGRLVFAAVAGRAELWLDGGQAAVKRDPASGPLSAAFPAGEGPRTVVLLVQADPGERCGLAGPVTAED